MYSKKNKVVIKICATTPWPQFTRPINLQQFAFISFNEANLHSPTFFSFLRFYTFLFYYNLKSHAQIQVKFPLGVVSWKYSQWEPISKKYHNFYLNRFWVLTLAGCHEFIYLSSQSSISIFYLFGAAERAVSVGLLSGICIMMWYNNIYSSPSESSSGTFCFLARLKSIHAF